MVIALTLLGVLLAAAPGVVLVSWLWPAPDPEPHPGRPRPWLCLCAMGCAAGLALSSGLYFLWLHTFRLLAVPYPSIEAVAVVAAGFGCYFAWSSARQRAQEAGGAAGDHAGAGGTAQTWAGAIAARFHGWLGITAVVIVLAMLVLAFMNMATRLGANPFGLWDAWAIWNLKAKFLYLGGDRWIALLTAPESPHQDYPLLQPASLARLWSYTGVDAMSAPQLFTLLIMSLTVAIVAGGVAARRGTVLGAAAAIVLLATPSFARQASTQYADNTVALFIAATLAALLAGEPRKQSGETPDENESDQTAVPPLGWLALAGLMASAAAWTKNEGVAFFAMVSVCLGPALLLRFGLRRGAKHIGAFILGALPLLLCVLWLKLGIEGRTDLFQSREQSEMFAKLTDWQRHERILQDVWLIVRHLPPWWLIAGWLGLLLVLRPIAWRHMKWLLPVIALPLLLQAGTYYTIFVLTPSDLDWHLGTAVQRLAIQLWPGTVMVLLALARPWPQKAWGAPMGLEGQ